MQVPGEEDMLHAGTVTGAYGVKGWVRVRAFTEPPANLLAFEHWFLKNGSARSAGAGADRPIRFLEGRPQGDKSVIVRIEGVADRSEAELLKGSEVWVPREELPELDDGEFYWHELVGMRVECEHEGQRVLLGEVRRLLETGANDVLVLRPCDGSVDDRERLVPYVPGQVVRKVDRAARLISVAWHPDD
jgi:16S rRNA processing protein RimM